LIDVGRHQRTHRRVLKAQRHISANLYQGVGIVLDTKIGLGGLLPKLLYFSEPCLFVLLETE
jgi:hypothetical protein